MPPVDAPLSPFLLLQHVSKFVCHEPPARRRRGLVLPRPEHHVRSERESPRAERSGHPAGVHSGMDPHVAEIVSEARLEKSPARSRERRATAAQRVDRCLLARRYCGRLAGHLARLHPTLTARPHRLLCRRLVCLAPLEVILLEQHGGHLLGAVARRFLCALGCLGLPMDMLTCFVRAWLVGLLFSFGLVRSAPDRFIPPIVRGQADRHACPLRMQRCGVSQRGLHDSICDQLGLTLKPISRPPHRQARLGAAPRSRAHVNPAEVVSARRGGVRRRAGGLCV